ncbi:MAG: hypothetical protein ABIG39_07400 [Candidatus Micrarchaeota archaeon]
MFGLFKPAGKIEIQTDKMSYSFGEGVKGKITLGVDGTKNAKAVRLSLYAKREVPYTDSKGRRSKKTQIVHSFNTDLDGEHEYSGTKEYEFELKIPMQNEIKLPEGALGQIAGAAVAVAQMTGMVPSQVRWYVKATLDVPGGRDASKEIQVNVG